ncbi:MAG: hypothetical protein JWP14_1618 [Frankiales bacterium]|nr:hypothetical protein [Frankiales bacterium]
MPNEFRTDSAPHVTEGMDRAAAELVAQLLDDDES